MFIDIVGRNQVSSLNIYIFILNQFHKILSACRWLLAVCKRKLKGEIERANSSQKQNLSLIEEIREKRGSN